MPDREHTDPKALDAMWNHSLVERIHSPSRPWYLRLRRWITEDLFAPFEPVEPLEPLGRHAPIPRRLRIYKRSVKMAKRLRWYREDEAREILDVTTMLLGFERGRRVRRSREASRS